MIHVYVQGFGKFISYINVCWLFAGCFRPFPQPLLFVVGPLKKLFFLRRLILPFLNTADFMKTVLSVYTLLMKTIYLSLNTQVAK